MGIESEKDNQSTTCPECGGQAIAIENKSETVCSNCGLVINERGLDYNHSGKRAYTQQEKQARDRTGSPISNLTPEMELTTVMNKKDIKK